MRSRWIFAAAVALVLPGALAGAEAPVNDKEQAAKLARSSNAFGFDLYQRLRQTPGNLVVSPASITTALAMPWSGARGETEAQMRTVLHLEGTADEALATSGQLSRSLQDPSRPIVFRIANQLFAEKTYKLVSAYVDKTRAAFGAPVEPLDWEYISLYLPKFEVNPGASLALAEDLQALGMPLAFDRDKADFTGIADPPNPADRLALSKVFHKAFVRVDEKGTEAAAATAVMGVLAGAGPGGGGGPRLIQVDRPFLFLIRDTASGLVLFLGRVSDPSRR